MERFANAEDEPRYGRAGVKGGGAEAQELMHGWRCVEGFRLQGARDEDEGPGEDTEGDSIESTEQDDPAHTGVAMKTTDLPHASSNGHHSGRWTKEEHQAFLTGLRTYGREWKKVAATIKTRTSAQIRSHAQKFFAKLARFRDQQHQPVLSSTVTESLLQSAESGDLDALSVLDYLENILNALKLKREELTSEPASDGSDGSGPFGDLTLQELAQFKELRDLEEEELIALQVLCSTKASILVRQEMEAEEVQQTGLPDAVMDVQSKKRVRLTSLIDG